MQPLAQTVRHRTAASQWSWMLPLFLSMVILNILGCASTDEIRGDAAVIDGWHTDALGPEMRGDCWRQHGQTTPLPHYMSCVGDFAGALGMTKDVGFFGEWNKLGQLINLPEQKVVRADEAITSAIMFSGAGADAQGMAQVTFDVILTKPDGSGAGAKTDLRCWVGLPPPDPDTIELCEQYVQFRMAPGSAPGQYTVTVYLRDHVKKNILRLRRMVEYTP